jgi:hypothetical protein
MPACRRSPPCSRCTFSRLDDRPGLLRVDRRHRTMAIPRCPSPCRPPAQRLGFRTEAPPCQVRKCCALSDFALDLRRIAARQSLPGYDLFIQLEKARELLRVVPRRLSTGTVDNCVEPIRRSGARIIRRSGATLSADQAHRPQLTLWPARRNGARNDSNSRESNSSVDGARKAVIPSDGAAPSRPGRRQ